MANCIFKNKEIILKCSNWEMDRFHEYLETVFQAHSEDNQNVIDFIERLDQVNCGAGGIYPDITKYFHNNPEDLSKFIEIVDKSIILGDLQDAYTPQLKHSLIAFKNKLNEYLLEITKTNTTHD